MGWIYRFLMRVMNLNLERSTWFPFTNLRKYSQSHMGKERNKNKITMANDSNYSNSFLWRLWWHNLAHFEHFLSCFCRYVYLFDHIPSVKSFPNSYPGWSLNWCSGFDRNPTCLFAWKLLFVAMKTCLILQRTKFSLKCSLSSFHKLFICHINLFSFVYFSNAPDFVNKTKFFYFREL